MRRKWKCGRWEGATDGGQHANSRLSLAEPSQTGMRAFPQVGAAWTLGGSRPASGPAPGKVAGTRGDGGIWPCDWGNWTGRLGDWETWMGLPACCWSSTLTTHTVSWYCLYLQYLSLVCPSDGVAQTQHRLSDQTDSCKISAYLFARLPRSTVS